MTAEREGPERRQAASGLTGRSGELDLIRAVIEDTGRTGGSLTLFGEPGVGKSALLDAAADLALANGMRTLRAAGPSSRPISRSPGSTNCWYRWFRCSLSSTRPTRAPCGWHWASATARPPRGS